MFFYQVSILSCLRSFTHRVPYNLPTKNSIADEMSVMVDNVGDEEKASATDQEQRYEPIHPTVQDGSQERTRSNSRASASGPPPSILSAMTRVRSQNGHGVADLEESDWPDDAASPARAGLEKDPFEVSWESEDEPLCPRSLPLLRKWIIVLIVGMGSLCV